jgi:hypothetical protein
LPPRLEIHLRLTSRNGNLRTPIELSNHSGSYTPPGISQKVCPAIAQNAILKELHLVHDVRDSIENLKRSLDHGVGIEPGMFDGDPLEGAIGNDHAVGAHQLKQTAMKLVSAALIVTVHQHDLGPDLVLFPALEMLKTSKADHVFLEAAPWFGANALLLRAYGNPTIFRASR